MKTKKLTLIFLSFALLGFDYDPAELANLKDVQFINATGYQYKTSKNMSGAIPTGEKILGMASFKGSNLKQLQSLLWNNKIFTPEKSFSACFQPRHTLVVSNESGTITTIQICFACHNYNVNSGPTQTLNLENSSTLKELFRLNGLQVR